MAKPKASRSATVEPGPHTGDVFAFIVEIVDDQTRLGTQIPSVDCANADAESFAEGLRRIFPRVQITSHVDSPATLGNIDDSLKREIRALTEEDPAFAAVSEVQPAIIGPVYTQDVLAEVADPVTDDILTLAK